MAQTIVKVGFGPSQYLRQKGPKMILEAWVPQCQKHDYTPDSNRTIANSRYYLCKDFGKYPAFVFDMSKGCVIQTLKCSVYCRYGRMNVLRWLMYESESQTTKQTQSSNGKLSTILESEIVFS